MKNLKTWSMTILENVFKSNFIGQHISTSRNRDK
jgi:hypothetical protein